ncbi:glycyl-radical enzyme activating protein [Desulfosarcina ovata]|uniref:Glycyl-radical enzyme activating protein n=2 Tax=Desulfosarcina ovata TaxID=83564 RepID=A0A5K8AP89_9BACT|nr:glycyl-radical enzyme activating protein [Desulfosarcina ovata]BBO86568.1 glycyl-radical enzyme activating protein [Desulfosarcina ovata subsp. sediminis]BBO93424.1 glycyl-radical enzyme activating protein [Desulfosarcina ovata subsp. ovata]
MENESTNRDEQFFITNIQRFSVNDGPGIRTTVFLKGCPLQCAWCHNPESISPLQDFFFDEEKCVRCGACAQVCPEDAIQPPVKRKFVQDIEVRPIISSSGSILDKIKDGTFGSEEMVRSTRAMADEESMAAEIAPPRFDRDKCVRCMECVNACHYGALTTAGRCTTVDDVYQEVLEDRRFYETSGGGMTISGGEPLMQPDVTRKLFERACQDHIHTTLDTTGLAKWETIERILPYVNLVLFDIKTLDDAKHRKWTGVSNRLILENVRRIASFGTKIRLRCVIVHDVNYWDLGHARGIVEFAKTLGEAVVGIDLMPYHNFADKKYEKLGRKHFFKGFPNIFREDIEDYRELIEKNGPWKPTVGGLIGSDNGSVGYMPNLFNAVSSA